MPETLAVVGSRKGADLEHVSSFLVSLWDSYPDIALVSGGAIGVDTFAEQLWLSLGGQVKSFRPVRLADYSGDEQYGIQYWDLGGDKPQVQVLIHEVSFADYASACFYRNMLIAEACTRLVAFHRFGRSRGASHAEWCAEAQGRPVFRFEATRDNPT